MLADFRFKQTPAGRAWQAGQHMCLVGVRKVISAQASVVQARLGSPSLALAGLLMLCAGAPESFVLMTLG